MYFNPPQNDKTSPFFHPLNRVNEEVKTIDKKKAKDIYDKLKKGSEIEVDFGNAFTRGGTPITLKVTSGHRVVGASRVGRIILVNKENPRGMKYKLFDRNGSVSLAQGDMGTILRDMKIVKEGVEELDEETRHTVHVNVSRTGFRKLEAMIASLDGYRESDYSDGKARFYFDAKKHDSAERKKVAEFIKSVKGAEFSHAIKEDTELEEELKSLFDVKPTSKDWMKGKLRTAYNQTNKGVTKEVMKKGQVIDLHPFDGDRFVGSPDRKDKGKYFFIAKYNVDAMKEEVELDESSLPAYDARLLRQALVLGKNAFKAGKKREPIKDPNLVSLRGFAKGKGKNEVMKQWLKGWDEMNLKDDVQIDEKFEFQFADKETAQKFMREVMQKRLGNSTGTRDGQVTTMTNSGRVGEPTMAHKEMAKIMKKYGGKLTRTDEGPPMAKIFEEVELEEEKKYVPSRRELKDFADNIEDWSDMEMKGTDSKDDKEEIKQQEEELRSVASALSKGNLKKAFKMWSNMDSSMQDTVPDSIYKKLDAMNESVELDEREKTEYIMKKKGGNKYSILRQTKSGPIGMFHDLDKKAAENIMKKLEGAADARDRRERGIPDVKGKYAGQRLFASYEGEDGESIDEMSAKAHYNKMVAQGKVGRGGRVVTPIDRDRFPNREKEGLEGPFRTKKTGLIYYYDKKAGKYYDPQSDMYLEVKDIMESSELEEMKRPMGVPGKMPMKGKFTDDQIDKLRDAYGKIGKINPTSQSYKNLTDYLDNLPDQVIKQLATVKPRVPFISGLALNRMTKRGIK